MELSQYQQERRQRKAERYQRFADNAAARSDAALNQAHRMADAIPFGQPILIGHHSEGRDRRYRDRIHSKFETGFQEGKKAATWQGRATAAEHDTSIRRADPEAVRLLTDKIAELEAERDEMKAVNAAVRKHGLEAADIPAKHRSALLNLVQVWGTVYNADKRGYPPYALQNLSGNLKRYRDRLAEMERRATVAEANGGFARHMPNKWANLCAGCGLHVPAREGIAAQPATGGWEVYCSECWEKRNA